MSLVTPSHQSGSADLLAILSNPEAVRKRLEQLQEAEERAKETITLAGKAGEILQLREEVEAELAQQKEDTQHSREECERLISEASASAKEKIAEAQVNATNIEAQAEGKLNSANAISVEAAKEMSAAKTAASEVASDKAQIDAKVQSLQQRAAELDQREQELIEEKKRLAEIRDLIQKAVS